MSKMDTMARMEWGVRYDANYWGGGPTPEPFALFASEADAGMFAEACANQDDAKYEVIKLDG